MGCACQAVRSPTTTNNAPSPPPPLQAAAARCGVVVVQLSKIYGPRNVECWNMLSHWHLEIYKSKHQCHQLSSATRSLLLNKIWSLEPRNGEGKKTPISTLGTVVLIGPLPHLAGHVTFLLPSVFHSAITSPYYTSLFITCLSIRVSREAGDDVTKYDGRGIW
ncbi:hypothetical protein Pmani_024982 [Petrolisthes manimaculis]|uniref:Uncharacterized protein n=1 Tax=Petrolisthes manimaculis TaxID=1843537 RepID=A0AAE1P8N0_9EUCA|nr:hypothetical protein Pmani_024982 [Petrolisthes manimaculis]